MFIQKSTVCSAIVFGLGGDIGRWQQDWITDRERGIYVLELHTGEVTDNFTYLALFWNADRVVIEIENNFALDEESDAEIEFISDSAKDKLVQMHFLMRR